MRFLDLDGLKPGDLFRTMDDAAIDWGMEYNGQSIKKGVELNSSIYSIKQDGKKYYSYSEPNIGTANKSEPSHNPKGTKRVATIHSHGNYIKGYNNNGLSEVDVYNSYWYFKVPVYGAFPDGTLWKFDPNDQRPIKPKKISNALPCDASDPGKKNDNTIETKQDSNSNSPSKKENVN